MTASDEPGSPTRLRWDPDRPNRLSVGNTEFNVAELMAARNVGRIVIRKSRPMVEAMAEAIVALAPRNVIELGIALGGSTAFLSQLAAPSKLVAIEKDPNPVPALDEYIETNGLRDVVKPYYGVDQADRERLHEIVATEFGGQPIDFVSDDASHLLDPTRASFNALFPYLRPGGVYMIEDWIWGHHGVPEAVLRERNIEGWAPLLTSGAPLTVLVFELVMTCASTSDIIDELTIDRYFVCARRGQAELDPATFDISRSYVEGPVKLLARGLGEEGDV